MFLSLSPMRYRQVSVCAQIRNTTPLFILFLSLEFYLNKSAPTNFLGQLHLGRHKTVLYYIQEGTIDPTYKGYISEIHLEYSSKLQYFNTPLNEKGIRLTTTSSSIGVAS